MELGEKIRMARLDAGLSQRQLCGDAITRNMLSQIENGSARPSMDTLRYLAARLGKSVSFFLEEQAITSPNQETMTRARAAWQSGAVANAMDALDTYRAPDPVFDQEYSLLRALCLMAQAENAIGSNRLPYARELLAQAGAVGADTAYYTPALERQRLLLLGLASPAQPGAIAAQLDADDRELLLRARGALEDGDAARCAAYLEAAQDREHPQWHLLRGEACFALGDHAQAAVHFHRAEERYPHQTAPRLEVCYREMGDFKRAYEYACKQR